MIGKYGDELAVGDEFTSHGRTLTEADVVAFTGLTWITDPIFTDETFARRTQFGSRAVPGPMILGYALGLTEDLVYGTVLAALGIDEVRFSAPTRPGATIRVHSRVTSHRESASRPGTVVAVIAHVVTSDQSEEPVCTFARTMLFGTRAYMAELENDHA
jgi:acyl dehydratase